MTVAVLDVSESVKEADEEKAENELKNTGQGDDGTITTPTTCTPSDRGDGVSPSATTTPVADISNVEVTMASTDSMAPVSASVTTQAEITPISSNTTGKRQVTMAGLDVMTVLDRWR